MIDPRSAELHRDLGSALVARSRDLRQQLTGLNPTDHRYEPLFRELVLVDQDIRSMRGERRYA